MPSASARSNTRAIPYKTVCYLVNRLDTTAVDAEIERQKPQVDAGGYVPCPDHRLPLESKWEVVQYYSEWIKKVFG